MFGISFLATELGYIGLIDGDEKCKKGDEIRILAGGSHPVALRPVAGKQRRYQVLTEAYVHGVMDIEAVVEDSPVLSMGNSASKTRGEINNGRTSWAVPEWSYIQLEWKPPLTVAAYVGIVRFLILGLVLLVPVVIIAVVLCSKGVKKWKGV